MDTEQLAKILEYVKVVPLHQDDIVVCRVAGSIDNQTAQRLRKELERYFGTNRKILVMGDGGDIEIIRPEAVAA